MATDTINTQAEREALIGALDQQRQLLKRTVAGLSLEQVTARPTVSALCLGGIIKHITAMERRWARFITDGPSAVGGFSPEAMEAHAATFRVEPGETLEDLLQDLDRAGAETDQLIRRLASLDESHPLPEAPWFPPGARWSARQVVLHILAETAQHSGHADIVRESLDGARTMG